MQVAGYANVQGAAAAGHDVGEVGVLLHGNHRTRKSRSEGVTKGNCRSFVAVLLRMTGAWGGRAEWKAPG